MSGGHPVLGTNNPMTPCLGRFPQNRSHLLSGVKEFHFFSLSNDIEIQILNIRAEK